MYNLRIVYIESNYYSSTVQFLVWATEKIDKLVKSVSAYFHYCNIIAPCLVFHYTFYRQTLVLLVHARSYWNILNERSRIVSVEYSHWLNVCWIDGMTINYRKLPPRQLMTGRKGYFSNTSSHKNLSEFNSVIRNTLIAMSNNYYRWTWTTVPLLTNWLPATEHGENF